MIVVADTSPLNYLIQLDAVFLLRKLYVEVTIPEAVMIELGRQDSPPEVLNWVRSLPEWVHLRNPQTIPPAIADLGYGEREAIALGLEMRADFILIDERLGTEAARRAGLTPIGVLGIFLLATKIHAADGRKLYEQLLAVTNFRASKKFLVEFERLLLAVEREGRQ